MKFNRNYIFISLSSLALLIVLFIQISWILDTARVQEELFNEKAVMVLSRTADALAADKETCKNMETCVGTHERHKVDSLFKHYMNFYHFSLGYYFEVKHEVNPGALNLYSAGPSKKQEGCYQQCIPASNLGSGLDIKLVFPEKEDYILKEMGPLFITSVILILAVIILSWRTMLSLMKEKRISENTTEFLNNMTHEFKTPLTNIALAGKMLAKENVLKQEEKIKHYSGIILGENEKLKAQVEQMLSMTALERGEIPLQKTLLDMHEIIEHNLKNIGLQVENHNGKLNVQPNADNANVIGDHAHLSNVLCNLIDNAIKYSGEKPEITIQTRNVNDHLILSVSDKGIGIDQTYHTRIFDKFFRVPTGNVHDVKGYGLGLTYVKKIVELHNGKITLKSTLGEGTTIIIDLPNA